MGYTINRLDGEVEFDLDYVQGRIKYLKALYMNKRSAKNCRIQLRAWFPGPIQTHQYYFECTRGKEVIEKTRVEPSVWDTMTKNNKTEFMGSGVEFYLIIDFVALKDIKRSTDRT